MCLLLALIPLREAPAQDAGGVDPYGGRTFAQWESAGFFRTHFEGKRWWLVTPDGHPFLSIGVCAVRESGHRARGLNYSPYERNVKQMYGTVERWCQVTRERLRSWGFNTLGAWSRPEVGLPWTKCLNCCGRHWQSGDLPDFFSREFIAEVARIAAKETCPRDKMLIGYSLDNELQWDTDWRGGPSLFDRYAALPADAAGKQALVRFFQERYATTKDFARVWHPQVKEWPELAHITKLTPHLGQAPKAADDREAFTLLAARQYFKTCTGAIRQADPNHLILGVRFVSWTTPEAVVKACGEYCDVVSVNFYELGPLGWAAYAVKSLGTVNLAPGSGDFRAFYDLTQKPVLISEFSCRADDSGLPNTWPPGMVAQPTVRTQEERGQKFSDYVRLWANAGHVIGYHWFCYMDEPKEGRIPDGENGNYGLVNVEDRPYEAFIRQATTANAKAWTMHSGIEK